jgi:hypothetical protein
LFNLLQHDDIGIVTPDFLHRALQADRGKIRILVVPDLTELHVELQDAKRAHARELDDQKPKTAETAPDNFIGLGQ